MEELERIRCTLNYQYGGNLGDKLLKQGRVTYIKSKNTGRIRYIYLNDKLIASVRASDGFIVLNIEGAKILHKLLPFPCRRVIVRKDVADIIAEGRNVFAKHVVNVDPEIRAGEEVLVVDEEDRLLAIGRAVLAAQEMLSFKRGIAVKVRRGVKKQK
ncbi:MAG: pseudouridine synthase [Thermoprotei archaeon]|nr:MAG: pseudouridine synthase [Thermoprotei archaeon]HDD64326.1 pseudouridine synthase [Thermoprotei archaeon]